MTDPVRINPNFAAHVDWNLLRLFADIVKAGGIGAAVAGEKCPVHRKVGKGIFG